MRRFLTTLILVFTAGLTLVWKWGLDHRLSYLSRDYALWVGKERLIDGYSRPGLVLFGDSTVMDGFLPEELGPSVVNCGLDGCTPIESYFLVRRLLQAPARPKAVLLSYNAYHFVHPDFYWENTVKFGMIGGEGTDEVMGQILRFRDKELLSGSGLWNLDQRLYSFLLSRGFPPYYISSLFAERYGVRERENEEALMVIARTRGQYYFPQAEGSKELNADTKLKVFTVSPVVDYYFKATLDLLKREHIPVYFYAMPINESSVPYLDPLVFKAYKGYLEGLAGKDGKFHILSGLRTVYPWGLFSDYAHLNRKGAFRFNKEFARILDQAGVPGGPYGANDRP
jgi:hypothetical protein